MGLCGGASTFCKGDANGYAQALSEPKRRTASAANATSGTQQGAREPAADTTLSARGQRSCTPLKSLARRSRD